MAIDKLIGNNDGLGDNGALDLLEKRDLDDAGTFAVAQSGIVNPILDPETIVPTMGPGQLCGKLTDEGSELTVLLPDDQTRYFGALLYWFMEGRPSRMDADSNGIPCETRFPEEIVDAILIGGWTGA